MTLANGCPLKVWKALHASIKVAFEEVSQQHPGVQWQRSARWCVDGKFLTSSGEAGIRKPAVLDLVLLVVVRVFCVSLFFQWSFGGLLNVRF